MKEQIEKHDYLRHFAKDHPGWKLVALGMIMFRRPIALLVMALITVYFGL